MPNDDEMYHLRDAVVARVALVMKTPCLEHVWGTKKLLVDKHNPMKQLGMVETLVNL